MPPVCRGSSHEETHCARDLPWQIHLGPWKIFEYLQIRSYHAKTEVSAHANLKTVGSKHADWESKV